ncbi:hypothetical protein [Butyricimonas virosa]|jgi:hypothetical protein|uniref:hypothetical protein n=1 Tax=Butyricimonas virosa TaxID=544645 RepID=UPI00266CD482|nr:hypothetical protein [Butyricimonas virosa]
MHTIFDSHFNLVEKLISLGFKELKECENETIFRIANNSVRRGQYIIIYIHHNDQVFENESIPTTISIYIGNDTNYLDNRIYSGVRPYTEEQFYYLFSSILPSKEYMEKLQDSILEEEIKKNR